MTSGPDVKTETNEDDLARSTASAPLAFHTKIPTLKNRGWDTPVTLLPDELQKWYSLIPCSPQEKRKKRASGPPVHQMNDKDIQILKQNDNRIVKVRTYDGETLLARVKFVSDSDQDLVYDLVSTTKESQYEKHDEQPAYLIRFEEIESVEAVISPAQQNASGENN